MSVNACVADQGQINEGDWGYRLGRSFWGTKAIRAIVWGNEGDWCYRSSKNLRKPICSQKL